MFLLDAMVSCGADASGNALMTMSEQIPRIVNLIVTLIKVVVPVLLIIFGMLDLGKAVIAQKEDEIKKGQQTFIKRLIAAAIVFFVIMVVQLVFNLVSNDEGVWDCVDCLINRDCNPA